MVKLHGFLAAVILAQDALTVFVLDAFLFKFAVLLISNASETKFCRYSSVPMEDINLVTYFANYLLAFQNFVSNSPRSM